MNFPEFQAQQEREQQQPSGFVKPPAVEPDNWAHRGEGMRCRTCISFVQKAADGPQRPTARVVGRCRKHAPTMQGFPVVFETDWCGDHKLDEGKV